MWYADAGKRNAERWVYGSSSTYLATVLYQVQGDKVLPGEVITSSVYWMLVDDDTLRIWKQAGASKSRWGLGELGGATGEL